MVSSPQWSRQRKQEGRVTTLNQHLTRLILFNSCSPFDYRRLFIRGISFRWSMWRRLWRRGKFVFWMLSQFFFTDDDQKAFLHPVMCFYLHLFFSCWNSGLKQNEGNEQNVNGQSIMSTDRPQTVRVVEGITAACRCTLILKLRKVSTRVSSLFCSL